VKLSIIIVHHQTPELLADLFGDLEGSAELSGTSETMVINTGCSDDAMGRLQAKHRRVQFIGTTNGPYGRSCNFGAARARGEYLLFLNADVRLAANDCANLVRFLDETPQAGACWPITYVYGSEFGFIASPLHPPTLELALAQDTPVWRVNIPRQALRHCWETNWQLWRALDQSARTPATSGAILVVRREAFNTVGGWDERFTLGYDDIDLCARLTRAGWELWRVSGTCAVHLYGQARRALYNLRQLRERSPSEAADPARYIIKHYGAVAGHVYSGLRATAQFAARLRSAWRSRTVGAEPPLAVELSWPEHAGAARYLLEISHSGAFLTTMARWLEEPRCELPRTLLARLLPRTHYYRVFVDHGGQLPAAPLVQGTFAVPLTDEILRRSSLTDGWFTDGLERP